MLGNLFKNPLLQKTIMSKVKELIKDNNIKHIVINVDSNGELKPVTYDTEIVVLTKTDYDKIIQTINSNL